MGYCTYKCKNTYLILNLVVGEMDAKNNQSVVLKNTPFLPPALLYTLATQVLNLTNKRREQWIFLLLALWHDDLQAPSSSLIRTRTQKIIL